MKYYVSFVTQRRKVIIKKKIINPDPFVQIFVTADYAVEDEPRFQRNIYLLRKRAVSTMQKQEIDCYICSLSTSTVVYKVLFTGPFLCTFGNLNFT